MEQQYMDNARGSERSDEISNFGMSHLDPDVIKFIHNNDPQLIILENELLGNRYDSETGQWKKDIYATQRMNEKGVSCIMSDIRTRLSNIVSLGKLDDYKINVILKRYGFHTTLWLLKHKEEWGIKTDIDRTKILFLLKDLYEFNLNKSSGGWAGNSLSRMYTRSDTTREVPQQKRGIRRFMPF